MKWDKNMRINEDVGHIGDGQFELEIKVRIKNKQLSLGIVTYSYERQNITQFELKILLGG
jgi:hypothetical protein